MFVVLIKMSPALVQLGILGRRKKNQNCCHQTRILGSKSKKAMAGGGLGFILFKMTKFGHLILNETY